MADKPIGKDATGYEILTDAMKALLHYFSPYYGTWHDAPFYVGQTQNIAIGELSDDRKIMSTLEFNMTGVNPL